jgi:hypothetical protein
VEHRCNVRHPASLDTVIESRAGHRIPGRIKNLSLGGVFIETGRNRPALNTIVDLSFSLPLNGSSYPCRISAMVVQQTERGMGVMFEELSPETRAALKTLIESGPSRRSYRLPVYAVRRAAAG